MECLKIFHRDILTVRSHQWKYYLEPYSGCAFQCAYCLYYKSRLFARSQTSHPHLFPALERDLARMRRKQIVYIGATTDPYQPIESESLCTRRILETLIRHETPVVLLTKSALILRDVDLLLELHQRGHVLVQFTVLTTNSAKSRALEPTAPPVAERLDAAAQLAKLGIPVHFHLSPVIPELYEGDELQATVRAIAGSGGRCIYSNILGMRHRNLRVLFGSVAEVSLKIAEILRTEYSACAENGKNVYSPIFGRVYAEMSRLSSVCADNRIDFICEFIPGLGVFKPAAFEEGIFRFGLPTVYQMAQEFEKLFERMTWGHFCSSIQHRFAALDEEYVDLVKTFWDEGLLFGNTVISCEKVGRDRVYYRSDRLDLRESVLNWD